MDGPLPNDTITYAYNAMGRVTSEANVLGTFSHTYEGPTSRLAGVTYPNGQTSAYSYLPNAGDRRLQTIHHRYPNGTTLSKREQVRLFSVGAPEMIAIGLVYASVAYATVVSGVMTASGAHIKPDESARAAQQKCWQKQPELATSDTSPRRLPKLPKRLMKRPVKQFSVALKLCISETGGVARTLVLRSSGDKEVDEFFQSATAEWRFRPTHHDGKPVPSVLRVSTVWSPE